MVSSRASVNECLYSGRISCSSNKELIASIREPKAVFVGWTKNRVRSVGCKSHSPIRAHRDRRHVRYFRGYDKERSGINLRGRLSRVENREDIEWIIHR